MKHPASLLKTSAVKASQKSLASTVGQHPAWLRLQPRERALVLTAIALVMVAIWWLGLVGPAWRQWTTAPQRLTQLHTQLQTMQSLATEAKALQAQPARSPDERLAALEQATRTHLGSGSSLKGMADSYTVQLTPVSPDALARWLAEVRINAQLTPDMVQLSQTMPAKPPSAQGVPAASSGSAESVVWQGSVRFTLGH